MSDKIALSDANSIVPELINVLVMFCPLERNP
jgi:hypothetical protein